METKKKEPLIRIEKRSERPHGQIIRLCYLPFWQEDCLSFLSDIIRFLYMEQLYPVHLEVPWHFRQLLSLWCLF